MAVHVYFVQRVTADNKIYSYSGFTLSVDPVIGARKVLKDWIMEKGVSLNLERGKECLAIKNTADKASGWLVFSLGKNGSLTFMGKKD